MSIKNSLTNYFDKRDEAARWADARFTEEANAEERAKRLAPAADYLRTSVENTQGDGKAAREAYTGAVVAALTDSSDNSRVLAREMAWARLLRRFDRGESVDSVVRSASAIELEALAAFLPSEAPHLEEFSNAAGRSPEDWAEYLGEVITPAYAEREAEKFAKLRESADAATADLALASFGAALLEGRQPSNAELNGLYNTAPELYRRAVGE